MGRSCEGLLGPAVGRRRVAILQGLLAAWFFSVTFVVNRSIALDSGYWAWSASLRYFLALPILMGMIRHQKRGRVLARSLRSRPMLWVTWGTVGFVLFYAPLTAAASFAPAWVVAGTWPITIVMGMLMSPLIYGDSRGRIRVTSLAASSVVLGGVALLQSEHAMVAASRDVVVGLGLVAIASVAYPLGNRKAMLVSEVGGEDGGPLVRLTAMTLGSMPAWLAIGVAGYALSGWPSVDQIAAVLVVAISSGVIATSLFFSATDAVKRDGGSLAAVEATQAAELPFTLLLEGLLLGGRRPGAFGAAGLLLVAIGILWHSRGEYVHGPTPEYVESPRP